MPIGLSENEQKQRNIHTGIRYRFIKGGGSVDGEDGGYRRDGHAFGTCDA